jgi:protein gp37
VSDHSAIEWTNATWNPVTGCTRVSPGCAHCYIERTPPFRIGGRRFEMVDGASTTGVRLHPDRLEQPLHWRKPRRVFVCSLADLFHEDVPDDYIARVFRTMGLAPAHTFQVLTKRPERALEFLRDRRWRQFGHSPQMGGSPCFPIIRGEQRPDDIPLPNVWIGVSIENARYTRRADVLREIPAAVRFISAEPLLGTLFPETFECPRCEGQRYDRGSCALCANRGRLDDRGGRDRMPLDLTSIDWVIVGGESGPGARPFHLEHAREILRARAARVWRSPPAIFIKQLGARPVHDHPIGLYPLALRDRKGGDMDEWPPDLRVREFPAVAT